MSDAGDSLHDGGKADVSKIKKKGGGDVEVTKGSKDSTTRAGGARREEQSHQDPGAQGRSPEGQVLRSLKVGVAGLPASAWGAGAQNVSGGWG